jgi:hypothetical protein
MPKAPACLCRYTSSCMPPYIDDKIIEVPVTDHLPDLLSKRFDVVGAVDHLLTLLLRTNPTSAVASAKACWHQRKTAFHLIFFTTFSIAVRLRGSRSFSCSSRID